MSRLISRDRRAAVKKGPGTRDQGPGTRDQGPGIGDQVSGFRDQCGIHAGSLRRPRFALKAMSNEECAMSCSRLSFICSDTQDQHGPAATGRGCCEVPLQSELAIWNLNSLRLWGSALNKRSRLTGMSRRGCAQLLARISSGMSKQSDAVLFVAGPQRNTYGIPCLAAVSLENEHHASWRRRATPVLAIYRTK